MPATSKSSDTSKSSVYHRRFPQAPGGELPATTRAKVKGAKGRMEEGVTPSIPSFEEDGREKRGRTNQMGKLSQPKIIGGGGDEEEKGMDCPNHPRG